MKYETELITPEKASKLLANNTGNRQVSRRHVDFLKNQMIQNKWEDCTGEMIKVAESGRLLDGQHRLEALVLSGTSQTMLVGYGFDEKIFNVIDTGKNRTASDLISMNGYKNATSLHAIARFVLIYNKDGLKSGRFDSIRIPNGEILNFIADNNEINQILNFVKPIYSKIRSLSASNLGGLYMIISKKNQEKCDEFFNKFGSGLELHSNHPIYLLRERLIRDSGSNTKLNVRDKIAMFIKAWNAFLMGKTITYASLAYHKDEKFPTIL